VAKEPSRVPETRDREDASGVFAGLAVRDYASSLGWYERFFGRQPDVVVHEEEGMWRIAAGGWIYVVADTERAGRGIITMLVDDLDAALSAIRSRGIEESAIEEAPGKYRKADFADPDGNRISIGQSLA
jgi:catechol 2,3-dioxygenase-like lactoylglutathione lyase family enzyme